MLQKISKLVGAAYALRKPVILPQDYGWFEINAATKAGGKSSAIPKIIWMYWDDINVPELINKCVNNVRINCPDYDVRLLNIKSIEEYIDLPVISQAVAKAQLADIIRLMLLAQYGGVWIDASVILQDGLDWITSRIHGHDAFLFFSDECTLDPSRPISDNWFIVAPENSAFIREWRDEFLACLTSPVPNLFYEEMQDRDYHLQGLSKPEYLLCYISCIIVLHRSRHKVLYASAGSSGHFVNYYCRWNNFAIAALLLLKRRRSFEGLKVIKICSNARKTLDWMVRYKFIRDDSIIGTLMRN